MLPLLFQVLATQSPQSSKDRTPTQERAELSAGGGTSGLWPPRTQLGHAGRHPVPVSHLSDSEAQELPVWLAYRVLTWHPGCCNPRKGTTGCCNECLPWPQ